MLREQTREGLMAWKMCMLTTVIIIIIIIVLVLALHTHAIKAIDLDPLSFLSISPFLISLSQQQ
jgi:succinate dehydrogenase hydrophobic anchor subunit